MVQSTVKHSVRIHVYGCFSGIGFGKLVIFTGILNAKRMIDLYKKGLLKSVDMLFGPGNIDWLLLEDNDPKHKSRLYMDWKNSRDIKSIDWPSQSPEANPIENVWRLMGLYQKGLLKSVDMLFGPGNIDWLLLENNDPKHKSRVCMNWKNSKDIKSIDCPAQSPDANPIENDWELMQ